MSRIDMSWWRATLLHRIARLTATAACLLALTLSTVGCGQDPAERILTRFETLTELLETHRESPDDLLRELEAFVQAQGEGFAADRAEIEALTWEEQEELEAEHEKALFAVMLRLTDTVLEIQDRLRDQPEQLARFLTLLQQIH